MSNKLFVGGLSWGTDDAGLRGAFERFGDVVEAIVIMDRESGRSRGFGFVTFSDPAAAKTAIDEMNGAEVDGRAIRVNEAEAKTSGGGGRGGGRGPGGGGGRGPGGGGGRGPGGGSGHGNGGRDRGSNDRW